MELKKLAEIFNEYFCEPFLPNGWVRATLNDDNSLTIQIGDRDVTVDEKGKVLDAGRNIPFQHRVIEQVNRVVEKLSPEYRKQLEERLHIKFPLEQQDNSGEVQ